MDTLHTIAEQLKARRRELRLTQDALALRAGLSRRTIIAMEAGRTDLSLARFLSILQVLGLQLQLSAFSKAKRRPIESELAAMFKDEDE